MQMLLQYLLLKQAARRPSLNLIDIPNILLRQVVLPSLRIDSSKRSSAFRIMLDGNTTGADQWQPHSAANPATQGFPDLALGPHDVILSLKMTQF
jgi:hypothetical protein